MNMLYEALSIPRFSTAAPNVEPSSFRRARQHVDIGAIYNSKRNELRSTKFIARE